MVEQTIEGWLTVLEKNGLCPEAEILENYGIDCETDFVTKKFHPEESKVVRMCGFRRETYSVIQLEIIKVSLVSEETEEESDTVRELLSTHSDWLRMWKNYWTNFIPDFISIC
jgi:hypothetical protein